MCYEKVQIPWSIMYFSGKVNRGVVVLLGRGRKDGSENFDLISSLMNLVFYMNSELATGLDVDGESP